MKNKIIQTNTIDSVKVRKIKRIAVQALFSGITILFLLFLVLMPLQAQSQSKILRVFYRKIDKSIVWTHEVVNTQGKKPRFSISAEEQLKNIPHIRPDGKTPLGGRPEDYGYYDILDTKRVNDYRSSKSKWINAQGTLHIERYTQAELEAIKAKKEAEREKEAKIKAEMQRILREQAIENLIKRGEIDIGE